MSSEPLIRPGLSTSIKKNLPKIKAKLRAKVPNVGLRDIQIRMLPYQEVLRNDLCLAKGCGAALELFNDMVENDGRIFNTLKYHEIKDDVRASMERLVFDLSQAKEMTSKIYLDLALHFETIYETFPWTTKELFEKAMDVALNYNDIYQQILVQYYYANFLFNKKRASTDDKNDAAIKIQTALVLARGTNDKWLRSENDESASLIKSVMLLYFKIFLQKAAQMVEDNDKQEAGQQIAMNVMAMIDDSLDIEAMSKARCFMEYGNFLQTNKLFLKAIDAYLSCVGMAKKAGDVTLKCMGLFCIANCYKKIENIEKAEKYSVRLQNLANDEKQEIWKAEALLFLAEINITTNIDKAIEYAEESFTIFLSLPSFPNKQQKLDQSRLIVGKLKSQKLYPTILHHIKMIEEGSRPHFFSLLNWQISRKF